MIARAAGITCSSCAMHFLRMRASVFQDTLDDVAVEDAMVYIPAEKMIAHVIFGILLFLEGLSRKGK